MIIYVDFEHDQLQQDPIGWQLSRTRLLQTKYRLEALSGEPCLIVRYPQVSPQLLHNTQAKAVLVSGTFADYYQYDPADLGGLWDIFRLAQWPVLGLCAGMQLLAAAYDAPLGPMGTTYADTDPTISAKNRILHPNWEGMRREDGFMPVHITTLHSLTAGLGNNPIFFQAHYWEVKELPAGFQTYASTTLCSIQMLAHESQPLFGTQFHPEQYDEAHPDGRILLENFFKLALNHP